MCIVNSLTNLSNKTNCFLFGINKMNNHVVRYFYQNIDYLNMYDGEFVLNQQYHKMGNIL